MCPPNLGHFHALEENSEATRFGGEFTVSNEFHLTGIFFFFLSEATVPLCFLLLLLYLSICHFNYRTAYYFYTWNAISEMVG